MVDGVTMGVITNLTLPILRDILVEETKFLLSVEGEVEKVRRISRSIQAVLKKADRKRTSSLTLEDYVNQLSDLGYEAGIVLERYAVEVESKNEGESFMEKYVMRCICFVCECCSSHKVGKQAKDIVGRLSDIIGKLELELEKQQSQGQDPSRLESAHKFEPHLVAMKDKIEHIVGMMKEGGKWQRVVTIYGTGGLGKTSLARKIHNHGDLESYARAWVCVTRNFQAKAVLGSILKDLDNSAQVDGMEVDKLIKEIHSILEKRKRSLIVLDDVWEDDDWEILKKAFPAGCNVLITARNAGIASQECLLYKLDPLTNNQGWNLLLRIALPPDVAQVGRDLMSLKEVGEKISSQCGGLPLLISLIGGVLRKKEPSVEDWKKVSMNIDSYLMHGEGISSHKRIKQVLDLSYDALPLYLKPCFLYFACFPKDEEIETERLYLLWIAEDLVSEKHNGCNESLMDVAERYLIELGLRSMVQVHKTEISSHQKYDCRLHGFMHELCSIKAEDENFVKRIEISQHRTHIPYSSIRNSISRLAITSHGHNSKTLRIGGIEKVKDLRSLMLIRPDRLHVNERIHIEDSTINLQKSKGLMILVLDGCDFQGETLPRSVDKLIHLRYLSLFNSNLREVPKYVCRMPYLHTLDLRVPFSDVSLRLPGAIRHMKKLRHLFLSRKIEVVGGDDEKLRLDGMVELETLENIHSQFACVADILKLSSLRKLKVTVNDVDSLRAVVSHMHNNRNRSSETYLVISNSSDDKSMWEIDRNDLNNVILYPSLVVLIFSGCSSSAGFPLYKERTCQNLVNVQLQVCRVEGNVNVIEDFGNYPRLQFLHLSNVEFSEKGKVTFRAKSFPRLKSLNLSELPDLEKWEVEVGAMPMLTELEIDSCRNLEKVPEGLRNISTIRELKISNMPLAFNKRVSGQDSGSVSHIPYVKLDNIVLQFS